MVRELNIFIENKPGRLKAVTSLLKRNSINMRSMTIQDREKFGLMKLVVDKPKEAQLLLSENGFACALKEIITVEIQDKIGGLDELLQVFSDNEVNIKDSYAFVIESGKKTVFCVEVEDLSRVKQVVEDNKFKLIKEEDLYTF